MTDLFSRLEPACGDCPNYGEPINPGVAYCRGEMTWRLETDRVLGCVYRDRQVPPLSRDGMSRHDALRDLLESPRHSIDAKGRAWLRAELRNETRSQDGTADRNDQSREAK